MLCKRNLLYACRCRESPSKVPEASVVDDEAVDRSGLWEEIEHEQWFTLRSLDLFRNRLSTRKRASPPARAPPVPERPGLFAEQRGTFPRYSWPGGRGTRGGVWQTLEGFVMFMWTLKGRTLCLRLFVCCGEMIGSPR